MKLTHQAPKGQRVTKGFLGMRPVDSGWHYNLDVKRWEKDPPNSESNYDVLQPCRTVKAFRRKLKHSPRGLQYVLVHRYIGLDVMGSGGNEQF